MIGNIVYKKSQDYTPFRQIYTETSSNISVPVNGIYRICAVGKGGDGYVRTSSSTSSLVLANGYCGGCGYADVNISTTDILSITINNSYSQLSINNNLFISATSGRNSNSGRSGTVQFYNVLPIINSEEASSNGGRSISIVPPSIYSSFLSNGGESGYYNTDFESDTSVVKGNNSGGNGIFGNDGGMGGSAFTFNGSSLYGYYYVNGLSGNTPSHGGGLGGNGAAGSYPTSTFSAYSFPGGGGGGGYGGGGGAPVGDFKTSYSNYYFRYSQPGSGGAGCVLIERIG